MPSLWLTVVVRKPEHSRVRHLQIHLRIFAVHTDLTDSGWHALHPDLCEKLLVLLGHVLF